MNIENQVREARENDIAEMMRVRNSVRENRLSDPSRITTHDYKEFVFQKGKGWVYGTTDQLMGFAVIDLSDRNIWALFVDPEFEGEGIGKILHDHMLNWYFQNHNESLWLSTSPGTRAEKFYRLAGWKETGVYGAGEIKFEISRAEWFLAKNT